MNETPETALRRALAMIEPESVRTSARIDGGYVELMGDAKAPNPTMASRAMNNRGVAAIYENMWRPFGVSMMGIGGLPMSAERAKAVAELDDLLSEIYATINQDDQKAAA